MAASILLTLVLLAIFCSVALSDETPRGGPAPVRRRMGGRDGPTVGRAVQMVGAERSPLLQGKATLTSRAYT
jgi:hypothetical protein